MTNKNAADMIVYSDDAIANVDPISPTIGRTISRRASIANIAQYLPANLIANVPFLPQSGAKTLKETFFCNICFMNAPVNEGFVLTNCKHQFCRECIKAYWCSRINDGQIFLKCFHPPEDNNDNTNNINNNTNDTTTTTTTNNDITINMEASINDTHNSTNTNTNGTNVNDDTLVVDSGSAGNDNNNNNTGYAATCGSTISELDIKAVIDVETWEKYERFKMNIENPNARQCPFCDHSMFGNENNPIMKCENIECKKEYCFFHSNAHDPSEPCQSYDARMFKENKLNETRINERAKSCPGCHFRIEKISGCNHMKCIKCQTSFCWLCQEKIENTPTPAHYIDSNSSCHGKQFDGMEDEIPQMWILVLLGIFTVLFGLPTFVTAVVFGILSYPFIRHTHCCLSEEMVFIDPNAHPTLRDVIGGFWILGILFLLILIVIIPMFVILCAFACIYRILMFIPPFSFVLPDIFESDENPNVNNNNNNNENTSNNNSLGYEADVAEPEDIEPKVK